MCNIDDLEHATLPDTCSLNAGEICNNFVCDFGYEKSPSVTTLTCTESLVWSHDLSTICIGNYMILISFILDTCKLTSCVLK